MDKIHYQTDQEDLYRLCDGQMFTMYDGNIKSAASDAFTANALREYAPDDKHFMLHVIAMGAGETYSCNRNGDYFSKEALEKYHDTFVKHGCFFREHRNRCQKTQGIGTIKASAYNDRMQRVELIVWGDKEKAEKEYEMAKSGKALSFSMSCFPAGTLVTMADGTHKPIEQVTTGDSVLHHTGKPAKVAHTMQRDYTGKGIELKAYGTSQKLVATEEHPIWVRPSANNIHECPVCGQHFKSLKAHLRQKKDIKHVAACKDISRYCEGFRPASQLVKGDTIRIPINRDVVGSVPEDKAWLLGLYLAEGHIHKFKQTFQNKYTYDYTRLDLTLGTHEVDLIRKAAEVLQRYTTIKVRVFTPKTKSSTTKVRLTVTDGKYSGDIISWLETHGGHLGHSKKLSSEALLWDPKCQRKIVEGWLDGDGTWSKAHETIIGVTTSFELAQHMQIILARCKIPSALNSPTKKAGKKQVNNIQINNSYVSGIDFCRKPEGYVKEPVYVPVGHLKHQPATATRLRTQNVVYMYVDTDGHLYSKLNKVQTVHISETVYDLTVPGDDSFIANGIGVHNCKIKEDVCSCCKQASTSPANYCTHLKHSMLQYLPEFKKYAYALNPVPKFFDISAVEKPADRIAHYLDYAFPGDTEKKASANTDVILGTQWAAYEGAELPEDIHVWTPEERNVATKLASAIKFIQGVIGTKSASTDGKVAFARDAIPVAFTEGLTDEDITKLRTLQVGTVFGELAKRASILPFHDFVSYVTGATLQDTAADPITKRACCMLPSIFNSLLESGCSCGQDMGSLFNAGSDYTCKNDPGNDDEVQRMMDMVEKKFSVKSEPVKHRVMTVTIVKKANSNVLTPCDMLLTPTSEKKALALAQTYGVYKISAMLDIARIHTDNIDEPQYLLAAAQHVHF